MFVLKRFSLIKRIRALARRQNLRKLSMPAWLGLQLALLCGSAGAWLAPHLPVKQHSVRRAASPVANAAVEAPTGADAVVTPTGRSALVLGWFHASDRELAYVRKLYKRNGFSDIVIRPSLIGKIAKPRGWYRSIRRGLRQEAAATSAATGALVGREAAAAISRASSGDGISADVSRHFDVVHCLSGGFLSLYVLLRSGSHLSCVAPNRTTNLKKKGPKPRGPAKPLNRLSLGVTRHRLLRAAHGVFVLGPMPTPYASSMEKGPLYK